ncbi:MAG: hypothetical protein M2R45_02618 [Verrucomicrobia subdivision 3 bacterium]|nr:hypothetical protein [Limisphaerales bacterium]MCS1416414.1 hypothetical protein [Limisphaerales bacterium]
MEAAGSPENRSRYTLALAGTAALDSSRRTTEVTDEHLQRITQYLNPDNARASPKSDENAARDYG